MSTLAGVMTKFRIDELSGVDSPAQKGARAAIMKRNRIPTAPVEKTAGDGDHSDNEGDPMSSAFKKALGLPETATDAEVEAAISKAATAVARVTELEATNAVAIAKAAMTDDEKAYCDKAKVAEKDMPAFMAKSAAERRTVMEEFAKGDEVITLENQRISKREVGAGVFEVLKAQAAKIESGAAAIAKAAEAAATAHFTKRATDEFPHVAGDVGQRVAVLKALDAAGEEVRAAGDVILKAAEATAKLAFTRKGAFDGSTEQLGGDDSAEAKLTKKAQELQKSDSSLTFAKAYDRVAQENPALYEETLAPKQ